MLTKTEISALKNSIDLRELAEPYSELSRESSSESSGPCPLCGGDDRFHVKHDWFFCRQCNADGGDAIAFLRWVGAAHSFGDAVSILGGELDNQKPTHKVKPVKTILSTWDSGRQMVNLSKMQDDLFGDDNRGADYLRGRSVSPSTWIAYGLGYTGDAVGRGAAISMPWYRGGELVAIRYRLLNPTGKQKIISEPGSQFSGKIYGGQVEIKPGKDRILVVCEGEINAMSIYQVSNCSGVDVLSVGSESANISSAMVRIAQQYGAVIAWFDKNEVANEMAIRLGGWSVTSPNGRDANDLLQAMRLEKFVNSIVENVKQ